MNVIARIIKFNLYLHELIGVLFLFCGSGLLCLELSSREKKEGNRSKCTTWTLVVIYAILFFNFFLIGKTYLPSGYNIFITVVFYGLSIGSLLIMWRNYISHAEKRFYTANCRRNDKL